MQKRRTLKVVNARGNNLKNVTAEIPLGLFTCVTGVSGGGKSTLLIDTLYRMHERVGRPEHDRFLFAAHAIRVMASGKKDRTTDDMVNWAKHNMAFGERLPEIPDFAVDMHTGRGEAMGRDYLYFMTEASKVSPEIENKDQTYRNWILAALKAGKLT